MDDPCLECNNIEKRNLFLEKDMYQPVPPITKSKPSLPGQTLRQYQQSHQKYKHLIETVPDAVLIADAETGIILEANNQAAKLFGISIHEITGKHQSFLHPPELDTKYKEMFQECVREGSSQQLDNIYVCRADGTKIPVHIYTSVARVGEQEVIYGIFRNMTTQTQNEQELRAVFESSQDCILVWDKDYNYLYANRAAIDHVGTTPDKVIGKNIRDGLGHIPEFMNLWISRVDEVFKTQKTMRVKDAVPVGDQIVYSESVLSPVRYPGGEMFAVSVVYRDITEQNELRQELKESENKYRDLYENAPAALYRTRLSDGKVLMCNTALANMIGFDTVEECLENGFMTSDSYVDKDRRQQLLDELKEHQQVNNFQAQVYRLDGSTIWISISARLFPERGYLEGTISDITLKKCLTKTEKTILEHLMQGLSNKEIARALGRSVRTVEDHRAHIMHKLDVDNIVDLTRIALEHGIASNDK